MNTNIYGDFQICISVPSKFSMGSVRKFRPTKSASLLLRTLNLETCSLISQLHLNNQEYIRMSCFDRMQKMSQILRKLILYRVCMTVNVFVTFLGLQGKFNKQLSFIDNKI